MTELVFLVQSADEGGFVARAAGASIFTEGDSLEELRQNIREAVECHFEEAERPRVVTLHIVRDEMLVV